MLDCFDVLCNDRKKNSDMTEQFISEAIEPVPGTFDPAGMVRGEPGLPKRFIWRDTEYTVESVIAQWKESGACKTHGSEQYLRKHWYKVHCNRGEEMTLYFQRQPRNKRENKKRWWLYTIKI
jgi:hypothetical protein